MKILYVVGRYPVRSETFVYREISLLRRRGLDIAVVASGRPDDKAIEQATTSYPEACLFTSWQPHLATRAVLGGLPRLARNVKAIARWLAELRRSKRMRLSASCALVLRAGAVAQDALSRKAECLHAHWVYPSMVASLASVISKIPMSLTIHAHEVAHDNAHIPLVTRNAAKVVFCNGAAMNYLRRERSQLAFSNWRLVHHGVDLNEWTYSSPPRLEQGRLRLSTAGRLSATKGFARTIRLIARLRRGNVDATLDVVGDGPEGPGLKSLARELGVENEVRFRGWLKPSDVGAVLSESQCFVLLPDVNFHDGLPNVVLEALAIGRPVMLSPLPAAEEAVAHGTNGWILDSADDLDSGERILRQLSEGSPELDLLSRAARESVEVRHNAVDKVRELADVLGWTS